MAEKHCILFILDAFEKDQPCFESLLISIKSFINYISTENIYVGVVMFDNSTKITQRLIQISDPNVRQTLFDSLDSSEDKGIDIESGLRTGLMVLNEYNASQYETTFVLIVRHNDKTGNYVEQIVPELNRIEVICIAVGNDADKNLDKLSKSTNGKLYFAYKNEIINFHSIVDVPKAQNSYDMITICDEAIFINAQKTFTKDIHIENDIGRNMTMYITSTDFQDISYQLNSPSITSLNSENSIKLIPEDKIKSYFLKPTDVEPGYWTLDIKNKSLKTVRVSILVKCHSLEENPIQLKGFIVETDFNKPFPPIIGAELVKDKDIVIGAEVKAIVNCPDGTQCRLTLKNLKDTIYCGHFTEFKGSGLYGVSVSATNNDEECVIMSAIDKSPVNSEVKPFTRQQRVGCFRLTNNLLNTKSNNELKQHLIDFSTQWVPSTNGEPSPPNPKNSKIFVATPFVQGNIDLTKQINLLKNRNSTVIPQNTPLMPSSNSIQPTVPILPLPRKKILLNPLEVKPMTPTLISSTGSSPSMHTPQIPSTPAMIKTITPQIIGTKLTTVPISSPTTPLVPIQSIPSTPIVLNPTPPMLSAFGSTFPLLTPTTPSLKTGSYPTTPLIKTAYPATILHQNNQDNIREIEEKILHTLLVIKKSINSKKISDIERNSMKSQITTIDSYLSNNDKSVQQLKIYHDQLLEMKNKLI